jgi:hypothetical protein
MKRNDLIHIQEMVNQPQQVFSEGHIQKDVEVGNNLVSKAQPF